MVGNRAVALTLTNGGREPRLGRTAHPGRVVFTAEVSIRRGLQRFIVLSCTEFSAPKVEIAGTASVANRLWMSQVGGRLADAVDGIVNGKRNLVHDRDPLSQ